MADKKQLIKDMLSTLATNIQGENLNNRREIATYAISSESMDAASKESATVLSEKLSDTVDRTLNMVLSSEEFAGLDFTQAQYKAAKQIAALALDPAAARDSMVNPKQVTANGQFDVIGADVLGVEDMLDAATLSTEAYDGQATNNAIYFSIVSSFMAATQDKFGEAFFPTIVIDPVISGASIECEFTSLYNEITRSTDGTPDKNKFNKTPIVKAVYDNDLFGHDKNKVIPVVRPENNGVLLPNIVEFVESNGTEEITTAPLAFGKTIGLLGISQTDAQLAKGVMDNTDALDRRLVLDKVFFSLTGDNDGDDSTDPVTEYFATPVSMFPHSNFTYTTQDHNKDLGLTFSTEYVQLVTGSTTTVTGAASGILDQLDPGYTIRLRMVLHGDANTQSGDIAVYASTMELVEVKDSAGNVLPSTSSEYATIKAVIDSVKLEGYTVEAYRTVSNLRTRGQLVTTDRYTQIYTVPLRSGVSVLAPVNNATGDDNDAARLTSQITYAGIKTSIDAVKTLVNYADMLNNVTNNGVASSAALMGVGQYFVDAYYNEVILDMPSHIDSIKSSDRLADIKAVLVNRIKDEVINMAIKSNYAVANQVLNGNVGGKISVIIGTDPITANYITGTDGAVDLGTDYEAVVVSTPNQLVRNKIFITFGVFDSNRNTKANPLNFGQCFWSPTITTDVVRTVNGSTSRELTSMNRYLHVCNLPVLTTIVATNLQDTLGSTPIDFKQV